MTLSAKLLVLAHCSSSLTHLRPLALLFDYLTLLARYDLAYEVRDRARFLAGLIQSGGIGKLKREDGGAAEARGQDGSRMMLEEEDFRRGVMVEDLAGENGQQNGNEDDDASEKQSLTSEQVRAVLFEGKAFEATTGELIFFVSCMRSLCRPTHPVARPFSSFSQTGRQPRKMLSSGRLPSHFPASAPSLPSPIRYLSSPRTRPVSRRLRSGTPHLVPLPPRRAAVRGPLPGPARRCRRSGPIRSLLPLRRGGCAEAEAAGARSSLSRARGRAAAAGMAVARRPFRIRRRRWLPSGGNSL